jgi:hypothetical protein
MRSTGWPGYHRAVAHADQGVLEFKCTKTDEPRPVSLPTSAIAALNDHRKRQDEFRSQFGTEYRADLDLIFANHDGTPFKPDSISAAVSLLFRRLKLRREPACTPCVIRTRRTCWPVVYLCRPLSARLGHGSIRTTQEIYSHMIHGQDGAARKWEEFQNGPTTAAAQRQQPVQ